MTEKDDLTRRERISALLGLDLPRDQGGPVGARPDTEDLAALLDGRLDDTRRARVISHLVHDDALYEEWQLLAAHADLLPDAQASGESAAPEPAPWWRRWRGWRPALAAAGVAAALTVVVLTRQGDPIDGLYRDHGDTLAANLGELPEIASRSMPAEWNDWQTALAAGTYDGLAKLGIEGDVMGIRRTDLKEAAARYAGGNTDARKPVHDTGRLALMALVACQTGSPGPAADVLKQLEKRWEKVAPDSPVPAPEINKAQPLESACAFSDWALASLR